MTSPTLSVIIVSFNTCSLTLECIRRLYVALSGVAAEVWVVDNGSVDGSKDAIRAEFPEVRLIENETNRGFGAANNQAMRRARGEFFLLLNSDAFVEPDSVTALMRHIEAHPHAGVVGPRLLNADGSLQVSCYHFPTPFYAWMENLWITSVLPPHATLADYRRWPHDQDRQVDFVSGACLLVRRVVYDQIGDFDERFFMYSEETDWQRRMRDYGWQVRFTPNARVTHVGGASGAGEPVRINQHFFASLDYYELKHHGIVGLILLRLAMVVGCSLRALLWMFAVVASSRRRDIARSKVRLHCRLFARQLTHWPATLFTRV